MLNDDVYGDYNDHINDFDDDNDDEIDYVNDNADDYDYEIDDVNGYDDDYDTNSRDNPLKEELDQIFLRLGG